MGKKSRRTRAGAKPKREQMPFAPRPFEGLAGEGDWVALREIVPAATATATLADGREITIASLLPGAGTGLVKPDGAIWIGMQVSHLFNDVSRDLAHAIDVATQTEPGSVVSMTDPGVGPRLQDVLAADTALDVTVHDSFEYWMDGIDADEAAGAGALIEQADQAIVPTRKLDAVASAYWVEMTGRRYLRWILPHDEDALLLALARLRAEGRDAIAPDTRLIGTFRAHGLLVPVWELDADQEAGDLEEPATAFGAVLEEALASGEPLTPEIRSAKSALANRQITLR